MRRVALAFIALIGLGLVAVGHLGALHPAGDTISVAGPIFAVFALIAAGLLRGRLGYALIGVSALWLAVWGVAFFGPAGPAGDFVIYQKNLWYRNQALEALAADIRAQEADVVTLQEVSDRNMSLLIVLQRDYPHQHVCRFRRWSNLAILSRHPIVAGSQRCSARRALASAQITWQGQAVSIGSLHLPWPYPYVQAARLRSIEPHLADLPEPVVIGADFNIFPQTRVTRRVARLTGTRELRQILPTLYLRGLPMYLDQVLAPGGRVERRPLLGSDHYGLLARVRL